MYLNTEKARLYVEIHGQGKPVLLLHGNGEDHHIFDEALPLLTKNHTVITLDSRCHGLSQKHLPVSYDLMAEDVLSVIRQLKTEPPVLYGFSDGGIIGLLIAIRNPEQISQLIISGANLHPRGLKPRFLIQSWIQNLFHPDPLVELMLKEPDIQDEQLRQIPIPVHVLAGEKDLIRRKHTCHIAEMIPDSTLQILPGQSHGSYIVHNPALAEILEKSMKTGYR